MVHQTTLMELMAKVGGRDNPGKFFATQGQRDRLGQVAASTRHKDALGLALGWVGVSGELQIVPLGKPSQVASISSIESLVGARMA
jgi:hypothetical protein